MSSLSLQLVDLLSQFIPIWQIEVVGPAFSEIFIRQIVCIFTYIKRDLQNWNVDTSREVDPLENNHKVIGNFVTLTLCDFIKLI